jgi:hypothetical protein
MSLNRETFQDLALLQDFLAESAAPQPERQPNLEDPSDDSSRMFMIDGDAGIRATYDVSQQQSDL